MKHLVIMFTSMISQKSSKTGHVGSKNRSLGQILEKPCIPSRSHTFSQILMKLGQNVCLDEISNKFEIGSCRIKKKKKKKVTRSNLGKAFAITKGL